MPQEQNSQICSQSILLRVVTRGEEGRNSPGAESLRAAQKSPTDVTSTFFNTVHSLPKHLRFEHGGAKLVS